MFSAQPPEVNPSTSPLNQAPPPLEASGPLSSPGHHGAAKAPDARAVTAPVWPCAGTGLDVMTELGEDFVAFRKFALALEADLQPRAGLEAALVAQLGQTVWRLLRIGRMQDGLALRRVQKKQQFDDIAAVMPASRSFENLEFYERLDAAVRRRGGPSPEAVAAFRQTAGQSSSPEMQAFVQQLETLCQTSEKTQRRVLRRNVLTQLGRMLKAYQEISSQLARRVSNTDSPEYLAALMVPEPDDQSSMFVQRMEESTTRQLWRVTETLIRVRKAGLTGTKEKNDERSQ